MTATMITARELDTARRETVMPDITALPVGYSVQYDEAGDASAWAIYVEDDDEQSGHRYVDAVQDPVTYEVLADPDTPDVEVEATATRWLARTDPVAAASVDRILTDRAWHQVIRAAVARGDSVTDIARRAGITRSRVYQIRDGRR